MIKLTTLLRLQGVFAVLALAFLFASAWMLQSTGEPLGAAPVLPSVLMFIVYLIMKGGVIYKDTL